MKVVLRFADLHPLFFGLGKRFIGLTDPVLEALEVCVNGLGGFPARGRGAVLLLSLLMAAGAKRALFHSQEIVAGLAYLVIAVASGTTGKAFGFELVPHLGALEQFGDLAVART